MMILEAIPIHLRRPYFSAVDLHHKAHARRVLQLKIADNRVKIKYGGRRTQVNESFVNFKILYERKLICQLLIFYLPTVNLISSPHLSAIRLFSSLDQ